ncbi:MAG: hypothetical protein ACXVCG_12995 [Bdellovibrionota bacterium]
MVTRRRAIGTLALVCAAAAIWVYLRRDSYIASAVRTYGSAILGVNVKLRGAHLSLADQSVELRGLVLENPPGFKSRNLLQLETVSVSLDVSTLPREVIVIREISLLKPEITFEKVEGVSNFDVIQRNADSYVRAAGGAPSVAASESYPKQSKQPEKRWIISSVDIRDGHAVVLSNLELSIALPHIHLHDIGKRTNGATTADATRQVIDALTSSVTSAAASAMAKAKQGVVRELGKGAKSLGSAIHGLFGR